MNTDKTDYTAQRMEHWYVIRVTYQREEKVYEYALESGIRAFYPTIIKERLVNGKLRRIKESRIPNIFFVHGTREEIEDFVFHNKKFDCLRFYYEEIHNPTGENTRKPMIVPERQMESLRIVCQSESEDTVITSEMVRKFREGEMVRVREGSFKGVVGRVGRYQGQLRVGIVIDGLLTCLTAYVPKAFLDKLPPGGDN